MIRAHALYFTLIISLIIALISGSLVLGAFYYRTLSLKHSSEDRLLRNLQSGITLLLGSEDAFSPNEIYQLDLFDEEKDSICLKLLPWGLFDVGIVKSYSGKTSFQKALMYGYRPKTDNIALYLQDLNRPLSLCGNTILKGTCYLPKAGVERAYIAGKSYTGTKLIYGDIHTSSNTLPELQKERLSILQNQLNNLKSSEATLTENSFFEDTHIIQWSSSTVSDTTLLGNIILFSNQHLFISASAQLENILVFAPSITIESNFIGRSQFFAEDSIRVEKEVTLNYPSSLGIIKTNASEKRPAITIDENSIIQGFIFSTQLNYDRSKTQISINKNVKVLGQLYTDGYLDLKGSIVGNAYVYKFSLKTPASVYENHLLDAEINIEALPEYFIGTSLFETENQKGVMAWLK